MTRNSSNFVVFLDLVLFLVSFAGHDSALYKYYLEFMIRPVPSSAYKLPGRPFHNFRASIDELDAVRSCRSTDFETQKNVKRPVAGPLFLL